jgi:DNA-binding response OmpR family regulator
MLAILQGRPGQPISYAQLARLVWPAVVDYPAAHAVHHLHELAHRVRETDHSCGTIATLVGYGYVWAAP